MPDCNTCSKLPVCWVNITEDLENFTSKFIDKNISEDINKATDYFDEQLTLLAKYCYFYDPQT